MLEVQHLFHGVVEHGAPALVGVVEVHAGDGQQQVHHPAGGLKGGTEDGTVDGTRSKWYLRWPPRTARIRPFLASASSEGRQATAAPCCRHAHTSSTRPSLHADMNLVLVAIFASCSLDILRRSQLWRAFETYRVMLLLEVIGGEIMLLLFSIESVLS